MTKDEVIALARQAGITGINGLFVGARQDKLTVLFDFADLARAWEREECAKVCDEYNDGRYANAADLCAAAIRSRT